MALFEVVQDINPKSGSLEGGYEFYILLTQPIHASDIRSGIAYFKGVNSVALQKVNPYTFSGTVPSSSRAGDVEVTVLDQTGNRLGMTTFRYVDHEREMLKQLVNNKEKQCLFFSMWAQECALGKFGNYNTAQGGDLVTLQDQGQTKQQQSLQLLQLLVYTAAETDAQEFIKMIFSTSAGPIVFNSYKDKPPLPEDVARANGHTYLAQYLQDVNTRLSKEVGSEAQSNAIDWLELVKVVQTQASAAQVKEEKHPSESDDNSSDYFADSETSSHGSLGLDEANQPDSDSDSSIDKELCNIAGWYNEEPNKKLATCAPQEGPSCETPEVEKPPNREDSGAPLLDNKDRTPFEKEKPAADSKEEKDYAVGRGFINSLSQWFSTTRKNRKDETKSATMRGFNGATFFWGPFDEGDTSGQANVHSAENPQECADKSPLSLQGRTVPYWKWSLIVIALGGIGIMLAGIMLSKIMLVKTELVTVILAAITLAGIECADTVPLILQGRTVPYWKWSLTVIALGGIGIMLAGIMLSKVMLVQIMLATIILAAITLAGIERFVLMCKVIDLSVPEFMNTERADKDHMRSQRRTAPELKKCIVLALVGMIMVGIALRTEIKREWVIGFVGLVLVWLFQELIKRGKAKMDEKCVAKGHWSLERRTAPVFKYSHFIASVVVSVWYAVYGVLVTFFACLINTKKVSQPSSEGFMEQLGQLDKGDTSGQANVHCAGYPHGIEAIGKSEKELVPRPQQLHQNHWEKNKSKVENFLSNSGGSSGTQ